MDTGSQIAMRLVLGTGAIGLITGEGGITRWIMALLGLGTAAGVAGYRGMLGQNAKDFTRDTGTAG